MFVRKTVSWLDQLGPLIQLRMKTVDFVAGL